MTPINAMRWNATTQTIYVEMVPAEKSVPVTLRGPRRWVGKCKRCGAKHKLEGSLAGARDHRWSIEHVIVTAGGFYRTAEYGSAYHTVPVACGDHFATLTMVEKGPKGSRHECGAKCTSSHGPVCECTCKGANHGSAL